MGLLKTLLTGTSKAWIGLYDGTPYEVALGSASIPSGVICIWSGNQNNIPAGWALCNGSNGTPNLSNRFILGYGSKSCGSSGGSETVSLSTSNMPSHNHTISGTTGTYNGGSGNSHTHTISAKTSGGSAGGSYTLTASRSSGGYSTTITTDAASGGTSSHNHSFSGTTSNSGSGTAHNNMPPYYVLCYIMKL